MMTVGSCNIAADVSPRDLAQAVDATPAVRRTLASLAAAMTTSQVAVALVEGGLAATGAVGGALALLSDARDQVRLVHVVGRGVHPGRPVLDLPLTARVPLVEAVRSGQEVWIGDAAELLERYPDARTEPAADLGGAAALPLVVGGSVLGAVGWTFGPWSTGATHELSPEHSRLRELVRAGADAFHRAQLYDAERRARVAAEAAHGELSARLRTALHERDELVSALAAYRVDAEPGRRQNALMAGVSATLDSTPDPLVGLARVAQLSLPLLGDWCAIDVLDEELHLTRAAVAPSDAATAEPPLAGGRRPAARARGLPRALRHGKAVVISDPTAGAARETGLPIGELRQLRQAGLTHLLVAPMRFRGHTVGRLSFGRADPTRTYGEVDVALALRLGRRCAAALEYSRLRTTTQHAVQAREDFVAATSHELRTPLSHIKGFVSTLRAPDAVWDASTRDDFLAEIEQEADRLAQLVEDLLHVARIDASGVDPAARTLTRPIDLVRAGLRRVGGSLGDHPVQIQVAEDLPSVWVVGSQVERVIANLLDNAAKYSPPRQPITIRAHLVGTRVSVRVEDCGPGIPPDHRAHVFEPFVRAPSTAQPAAPGTGLGLTICRSIVRAHGGRIWAEECPAGGGAALVFTLPTARPARA